MRLVELNPEFQRYERRECLPNEWIDGHWSPRPYREFYIRCDFADAQGIWFECPLCRNHHVQVGFAGRAPAGSFSQNSEGKDSRWNVAGTGYEDLTLTPSIHADPEGAAVGRCSWHGHVTNGEITS